VVVRDLNLVGMTILPFKTNSILIVNPDAVLPGPIPA